MPQSQAPNGLGSAHVKDVAVTLPPGMTISPSAANGLEACTDAQFAQGTHDPIACPAASRIGDATISTPLLSDALTGSVYLGQPLPGDRYRLFVDHRRARRNRAPEGLGAPGPGHRPADRRVRGQPAGAVLQPHA